MEIGATRAPLLRTDSTRPSASSNLRASRTGMRLMEYRLPRFWSFSCMPGSKSPLRMEDLIPLYATSTAVMSSRGSASPRTNSLSSCRRADRISPILGCTYLNSRIVLSRPHDAPRARAGHLAVFHDLPAVDKNVPDADRRGQRRLEGCGIDDGGVVEGNQVGISARSESAAIRQTESLGGH